MFATVALEMARARTMPRRSPLTRVTCALNIARQKYALGTAGGRQKPSNSLGFLANSLITLQQSAMLFVGCENQCLDTACTQLCFAYWRSAPRVSLCRLCPKLVQ